MITITDGAADKVREIAAADGREGKAIRLYVVGGGCAGFDYGLYFEDDLSDTDDRFEDKGVTMVVDQISVLYLAGTELDWVEGPNEAGFKFNNPNVAHTCGCGQSCGV
ncbi:MAG: iron-sulfur cluster assembly accessory protein [Deltaproteobacteria bacterium]|nr:iron-sulfur cluster assembly accessory protein [Deltaproteobacteria bacterium]